MHDDMLDRFGELAWRLRLKSIELNPRLGSRERAVAEQVKAPYPRAEPFAEPGFVHRPGSAEPVEDGYNANQVRLWAGDRVVDLVRGRGRACPEDVGLASPLVILSGWCPPDRRSTALDNAVSLAGFGDALARLWQRHGAAVEPCRAVLYPEGREWVEIGAAFFGGVPVGSVREFAVARGLPGFMVWDGEGLRFEWADARRAELSFPVGVRDVRPGCPMQTGHPGRRCIPQGGPWVAASQRAALFWTAHQRMLIGAFGCGVCDGDRAGLTQVVGFTDLVQSSRCGGWDFGAGPTTTIAKVRPVE